MTFTVGVLVGYLGGTLMLLLIRLTEVTLRSREQMQSVVRQQDAALSSDESGGSAAGNPDGHNSIEAFEAWVKVQDGTTVDYIYSDGADTSLLTIDELTAVSLAIQKYKGQGAA